MRLTYDGKCALVAWKLRRMQKRCKAMLLKAAMEALQVP